MLSPQALDDALAAVLDRPLWLGMADRLGEADYGGYQRQPVAFGPAFALGDGRQRSNAADIRFPALDRDAEEAFVLWQLYNADGTMIVSGNLARPLQPRAGELPFFATGTVTVGLRG